ncbi:class I SAM-dependent methyltransferase [Caldisericum exile]|uniref:class I SAM-dependent methyltransferase n=1 Tax=Caldisericum exile TaxID=693075 RepID=UPI00155A765E|nr:class I SAM-dependent methyltransferase [Caldisericum exile]
MKYFLLSQKEERTKVQVDFVEKFLKKGSYILDTGCGIGRHSIELAKRGYKSLGIDSNPLYVNIARETKNRLQLENVEFEVMDMREIPFENTFDAIINMWSSFGYFDDATNENIILLFYKALKKGGFLLIDIENRDYILKYFIRETFKEKEDGVFILERRKFDPITSVVSTHRYILGPNIRKDYLRHIRIYSLTEMINIFKRAGFNRLEYFGNYNFEKFHVDSERILIIGFK